MSIEEIIKNKETGLYYGSRIILPFKANFLKIVIEKDVITDFSNNPNSGVLIEEEASFTNIYFLEYKKLESDISQYHGVKLLLVEKNDNVFDQKTHKKVILYLKENHLVEIEELDKDILFID